MATARLGVAAALGGKLGVLVVDFLQLGYDGRQSERGEGGLRLVGAKVGEQAVDDDRLLLVGQRLRVFVRPDDELQRFRRLALRGDGQAYATVDGGEEERQQAVALLLQIVQLPGEGARRGVVDARLQLVHQFGELRHLPGGQSHALRRGGLDKRAQAAHQVQVLGVV